MKCCECAYWWADGDEAPDCHYNKLGDFDLAPCEQEDNEYFSQHDEEDEALWMI